ncbi:MAG: flagellar motor switch protein FliM [Chloroflexota bacterium]|nr:flagellar motor switch protein FliM [Chloroflexota bacterium]
MSKTLSQWEIDALLSSLGGDEVAGSHGALAAGDTRSIKLYDFRRPDKFSKEHIRAIQNIHETFARVTASSLSSYLRATTTVSLSSIEQVVYDEYIQQLPNPTLVNLVELHPLSGRIVVELNMNLGLAMLDRMMGGPGKVSSRRTELTDIEMALLRSLGSTVTAALKDGWAAVADLQPVLVDTVLNAELVRAALAGDIAALLLFEVHMLGLSGMLSICVPHPVIEPLMDRLNTQAWFSPSSRKVDSEHERLNLAHGLSRARLPLSVELGSTTITLGELLDIRVGDVLRLDRSADGELPVLAGKRARFVARPGTLGGNRAVQVTGMPSSLVDLLEPAA